MRSNHIGPGGIAALAYWAAGLAILPFFRYQINTDGTSYISIAQKYLHGEFHDAINGLWSPLMSWLLVPPLMFGADPLLASRLVSLFCGFLMLLAFIYASNLFEIGPEFRKTLPFFLIPILLYYSNALFTGDLLVSGMFLLYLALVMDHTYLTGNRNAVLIGCVAALCYFAKYYAFPLLLIHFPLATAVQLRFKPARLGLRRFALACVVFLGISGLWITALSFKYGHFTYSTAGNYNIAIGELDNRTYIMDEGHLVPPPNPTALSIWEDPTLGGLPTPPSPLKPIDAFLREVRLVGSNLWLVVRYTHDFTVFASAIVIGYLFLLMRPTIAVAQPLLALLLYPLGYALIRVEPRYLWPMTAILFLMAAHLATRLRLSRMLFIPVIASFVVLPTVHLIGARNSGLATYQLARALDKSGIRGNVASNGNWNQTLYLATHLQWRYYGCSDGSDLMSMNREFKQYAIQYFLVWYNPSPSAQEYLGQFPEIARFDDQHLRVLKIQ